MEQITLDSAEAAPAIVTTFYRVIMIALNWEARTIAIVLRGENGERKSYGYEGDEAAALMVALNKANLSTQSLHRRVLARLVADGKIAGAVNGAPD